MRYSRRILRWSGLIAVLVPALFGIAGAQTIIVKNGKSEYHIVVRADADSIEKLAASQLQKYIFEISGATLPLDREPATFDREFLVGRTNQTMRVLPEGTVDSLEPDGYLIRTAGEKVLICGGAHKGTLYGVYSLLEDYLGCRKYSAEVTLVPKNPTVKLPALNVFDNPFFKYRQVYYLDELDQSYCDWHKLYSPADMMQMWGLWVHTFNKLVPPEEYFQSHPEYYTEIGGHRVPSGQLCLSNPDVLDVLVNNLKKLVDEKPGARYWSVSQNDNFNECQCDSCKALDAKYGGSSGAMINFVNRVAARFPDKIISTLAYQYTRAAPTSIKPDSNVNVMLCSIECNRSRPISTDPGSASFRRDLEDWSSLTHNIIMWDYVVQFRNLVSPFPNFRVLQPNVDYFKRNGIRMIFEQGCGPNVGEFCHLRSYILAKLLWNPDVNVDSVMNDFLDGYYGAAGPYIRRYIDAMENALESSGKNLDIYGYPYDAIDSYLTPQLMRSYSNLFDRAERAVANHKELLARVKIARLPLEYAVLDISLHDVNMELSYFNKDGRTWTVKRSMIGRLDRFVAESERAGIVRLEEHGTSPEDYRKSVMHMLHVSIKGNMAFRKPVSVLTQYSAKYPVGGGKALTDGLHGPDDYHCNWLGFEGNDCEAIVDLQSVKKVRKIETSFLQEWYAWIWLPLEVDFSVSTDGKIFRPVGVVRDPVPDTTGGAFSTPFNLNVPDIRARYIKVDAVSRKVCPDWHIGAGQKSWIFIDEIVVR